MQRDLDRPRLDALTRKDLTVALSLGPWCWPPSGTGRRANAEGLVSAGPPQLSPGTVLLVTVSQERDTAWLSVLRLGAGEARDPRDVPLAAACGEHWEAAAIALPRSLPILWRSVDDLRELPGSAVWLETKAFGDRASGPPTELAGASLGLAFLLAMASRLLGQPIPSDVAASACVEADGRVGKVDALDCKIALLEDEAPTVRRLLVAAPDVEEAKRYARRLEVVPIDSAAQAVNLVFGGAFEQYLRAAGRDEDERKSLVESFFRLAIRDGRGPVVDWTPVERGADLALREWVGLSGELRWKLQLARAVAARHERNGGDPPLPDRALLQRLPAPLRISVVIQLTQSCADAGRPEVDEVLRLATEDHYIPEISESFGPHLQLRGARARLLAVTGDPEQALVQQEDLAKAFLARLDYEELSFQLGEWLRLAGALGDAEAFARAEVMLKRAERFWSFDRLSRAFMQLGQARGLVTLSLRPQEAGCLLEGLETDPRLPAHVWGSSARWLGRLLADRGDGPGARQARDRAKARAGESGAQAFAALCCLDEALGAGDEGAAGAALQRLADVEPGAVGHLRAAAQRRRQPAPAYVALFYPY